MTNILDILNEIPTPSYLTEAEFYELPVNELYAANQLKKKQQKLTNYHYKVIFCLKRKSINQYKKICS